MVMQNKLAIIPSKSCHTFNQGYLKYIFTFLLTPFLLWPYRLFTKCRLFLRCIKNEEEISFQQFYQTVERNPSFWQIVPPRETEQHVRELFDDDFDGRHVTHYVFRQSLFKAAERQCYNIFFAVSDRMAKLFVSGKFARANMM